MGCIRSKLQHEVPNEDGVSLCSYSNDITFLSGRAHVRIWTLNRMFRFGKSPRHLFPDLQELYNCPYYWGKLDESDIDQAFQNKPLGSFLLRDATETEKDNLNTKWMTLVFSYKHRSRALRSGNKNFYVMIENSNGYGRLFGKKNFEDTAKTMNLSFEGFDHDDVISVSMITEAVNVHLKVLVYTNELPFQFPINRELPFSLKNLSRAAVCDSYNIETISEEVPGVLTDFCMEYFLNEEELPN